MKRSRSGDFIQDYTLDMLPLEALSQVINHVPQRELYILELISKSFHSLMNEKIIWKRLCFNRWTINETELINNRNQYITPYDNSFRSDFVIDWRRLYALRDESMQEDHLLRSYYKGLFSDPRNVSDLIFVTQIFYENKHRIDYSFEGIPMKSDLVTIMDDFSWSPDTQLSEKIVCSVLMKKIRKLSGWSGYVDKICKKLLNLFNFAVSNGHENLIVVCDKNMIQLFNGSIQYYYLSESCYSIAITPLFYRLCQIDDKNWVEFDSKEELEAEILQLKRLFRHNMYNYFRSNIEDGLKSSSSSSSSPSSDNNNWKSIFGSFFFLKIIQPITNNPELMYAINYLLYPHKAIRWISSGILYSTIVNIQKPVSQIILTELITKVVEISNDPDPYPEVLSNLYPCLCKILNVSTVQTYEDQMITIIKNLLGRRDVIPTVALLKFVEMVAISLGVKFNVYYSLITGLLFSRLKDSEIGDTLHILKTLSTLVKLFKDDETKIIISTIGSLTEKMEGLPLSYVASIFKVWNTIVVRTVFYIPHRMGELTAIMNRYYLILCKEALRYCSVQMMEEKKKEKEKEEEEPKHRRRKFLFGNPQTQPIDDCQTEALCFLASMSNFSSIFVSIFPSVIDTLKPRINNIERSVDVMKSILLSVRAARHYVDRNIMDRTLFQVIHHGLFEEYTLHYDYELLFDWDKSEVNMWHFKSYSEIIKSKDLSDSEIASTEATILDMAIELTAISSGLQNKDEGEMDSLVYYIVNCFRPFVERYASKLFQTNFVDRLCLEGNSYTSENSFHSTMLCCRLLNILIDNLSQLNYCGRAMLVLQTLLVNIRCEDEEQDLLISLSAYGLASLMKVLPSETQFDENLFFRCLTTISNAMRLSNDKDIRISCCYSIFRAFRARPKYINYGILEDALLEVAENVTDEEVGLIAETLIEIHRSDPFQLSHSINVDKLYSALDRIKETLETIYENEVAKAAKAAKAEQLPTRKVYLDGGVKEDKDVVVVEEDEVYFVRLVSYNVLSCSELCIEKPNTTTSTTEESKTLVNNLPRLIDHIIQIQSNIRQ
eukprot:TRINITY_DN557_c0_g1_i17.p1 TRINITY_DN557_c0_g1~~TRINITY_DN557_c0_g1_i17.p1  ORF type:complete len:1057 (-),score=107.97 TRINITY_DN557_c0_g1_i17:91-3261(-)